MFYWNFGKARHTYPSVFAMYILSFLIVPIIQHVKKQKLSLYFYFPIYGLLQIAVLSIGISTCVIYTLPPASALIVTAEMARLSMKMHAYFREKIVNGL